MKKVLIIVGDASETLDTLYPFYRLQEAGIETDSFSSGIGSLPGLDSA
ncbi:MAG: hypothetical protein OSB39_13050 [Opitutales bacterium]|nr:hypothetical protein [Opitutales bacterium]